MPSLLAGVLAGPYPLRKFPMIFLAPGMENQGQQTGGVLRCAGRQSGSRWRPRHHKL